MRAVNVLLSILISLALAFLVFEGGLRLVGFGTPPSLNEFHPKLGWTKKKNAEVPRSTAEFDVVFETNAEGLRDDPTAIHKQDGVFRVMMLGDSFVQGFTVDREDLFVDLLEGRWASEERRVEVINAGTEAYSTDQEALWFREEGKRYEPDVVVVFPYLNDVYWNSRERYNRYPKPRFDPDGTLATGTLEDPGEKPFLDTLAIRRFLLTLKGAFRAPGGPLFFQPEGAERPIQKEFAPLLVDEPGFLADALARTEGALKALKADAEAVGAELYVCPIPPEMAIHEDERVKFEEKHLGGLGEKTWDPKKPVSTFLAMADDLGIPTMNPTPALERRADDGERLYFKDEWHFNPAGNLALADFLYAEFDERGVFPPEHQALRKGAYPAPPAEGGTPTWMIVFGILWLALTGLYLTFYRDEPFWQPPLKIAGLLAAVFTIVIGGGKVIAMLPPAAGRFALILFVLVIVGFIVYKLGRRTGTILELLKAFTVRGHWYLMPLVVILLTIGSLLVVAASSPLVAPFIYTLF